MKKLSSPRFDLSFIPPNFATATFRQYLVKSAECQREVVMQMNEQARILESLAAWAQSQGWTP